MRKTSLAALAALTLALPYTAHAALSEAACLWLLISPGSRPAGMGEAFVAVADDASATWWNPAGLAWQQNSDLRFMHTDWLPAFNLDDLFYDFLAYSAYVPSLGGTVGGNIVYMNEGEQAYTDETGSDLGTIKSREFSIGVSYGTLINPDLAFGVGFKYIHSDLASGHMVGNQEAGVGRSVGLDLGILWKARLPLTEYLGLKDIPLNLGANISNIGPEISYVDEAQADPLPTNLKFGFAMTPYADANNQVTVVFDINKELTHRSLDYVVKQGDYWDYEPGGYDYDGNGDGMADDHTLDDPDDEYYTTDNVMKAMFTSWFPNGTKEEFQSWLYNMGAEYWYRSQSAGNLGNMAFGVRAGYLNDMEGSIKSYTSGFSILVNMFAFDFSYEASVNSDNKSPRDRTMRYSLGITF